MSALNSVALSQSAVLASGRASIEGRVTLAGKPASGVGVTVTPKAAQASEPIATSVTDEAGRFKFGDLEAGSYFLDAFAPSFVGAGASLSDSARGKPITVDGGETVTEIEIALIRGGAITGRVVDSNRQPIIDMTVDLRQMDQAGRTLPRRISTSDQLMYKTDDTGSYRIYGLPEGRYRVSAGAPRAAGAIRYEGGYYPRTFHPNVEDEAQATIVEVAEGREAANIDITVRPFVKSYSVSGHIVNSETGKRLAGFRYGYGAISESGQYVGSVAVMKTSSTAKGEFYIEGLPSGRYAAFVVNEGDSPFYCEPALFEITDSDVSDIEVKTRSGAGISGIIAFEDDSRIDVVENLTIDVITVPSMLESFRKDAVRITTDGRFAAVGLRPGKALITVRGSVGGKSVILSRIEHDGVTQPDIELRGGESLTGIRLVLSRP